MTFYDSFSVQEEYGWLQQIIRDPRLLQALRVMCAQVQHCRLPYAPLLACHYQLGGKFKFPSLEVP